MKVAVTGAAGLTGGAVVAALAERGHEVCAIVRGTADVALAATTARADVSDAAAMRRALAGMEALVHVAGIQLGESLAGGGALRGIRRVVVTSTAGVYSRHRSSTDLYERNERALRAARPDVALVRPTMIYGSPRDRNIHHIVAFARRWRFLPVPGDGSSLIQPIHYRDLAVALALLAERDEGGVVDAGGSAPVTLRGAALAVFDALEWPARLLTVPLGLARGVASAIDIVRGSRWRERVERTLEDRSVDNARLVQLTGIRPRDLAAGLRDAVREIGGR